MYKIKVGEATKVKRNSITIFLIYLCPMYRVRCCDFSIHTKKHICKRLCAVKRMDPNFPLDAHSWIKIYSEVCWFEISWIHRILIEFGFEFQWNACISCFEPQAFVHSTSKMFEFNASRASMKFMCRFSMIVGSEDVCHTIHRNSSFPLTCIGCIDYTSIFSPIMRHTSNC